MSDFNIQEVLKDRANLRNFQFKFDYAYIDKHDNYNGRSMEPDCHVKYSYNVFYKNEFVGFYENDIDESYPDEFYRNNGVHVQLNETELSALEFCFAINSDILFNKETNKIILEKFSDSEDSISSENGLSIDELKEALGDKYPQGFSGIGNGI